MKAIFAMMNLGQGEISCQRTKIFLKIALYLIPNLVSTVKGYASHEKETLQAVVEARAKAFSGVSVHVSR